MVKADYSFCNYITQTETERRYAINRAIKGSIAIALISVFLLALSIAGEIWYIARSFPDVALLNDYKQDQTTLIYDINDNLLANIHGDEDRIIVELKDISPHLISAVIAIEDIRFYKHNGIDLTGTIRALVNNFTGQEDIQGGSSITQQLVKNSFLTPEKSFKRKFVEAILAARAELKYSKNEILTMYLNKIYMGSMSYGVEKASKKYFKKSAKEINLAEAAFLAGLIKAPEGYSPYKDYKSTKFRQKLVLQRMEQMGFITKEEEKEAEKQPLLLHPKSFKLSKYPYFVDYVVYKLRERYGDQVVKRGGLKVFTTIDPEVQEIAEKTIKKGVGAFPRYTRVKQGALVSIKVENGYIQAMVGGVNFAKSNYNRAFQSRRAAGSSFKPVVYLTGFRLGVITPNSTIYDSPISYNTGWNIWRPHNWDGKYYGKMTVRGALTQSRNTPTVRVALMVGYDAIIQTARMLGIKSHIDKNYSIALGSLGISPLDMATVYSTLARDGVYIEPTAIRKIEDHLGNVIEIFEPTPNKVINSGFVKQVVSILIDVVNKGTGRQARLPGRQVAGKTGTTDQIRDVWFTGFTPDTVTTIWMGNDANLPLNGVFSFNCAQLWGKFSKEYYKVKEISPNTFTPPNSLFVEKLKKLDKMIAKEENRLFKDLKVQDGIMYSDRPKRKLASNQFRRKRTKYRTAPRYYRTYVYNNRVYYYNNNTQPRQTYAQNNNYPTNRGRYSQSRLRRVEAARARKRAYNNRRNNTSQNRTTPRNNNRRNNRYYYNR